MLSSPDHALPASWLPPGHQNSGNSLSPPMRKCSNGMAPAAPGSGQMVWPPAFVTLPW
ncbi:hypothetical protein Micbo1qcDRAFT_167593 [Microdochium bolleyi]|uniref:Uncharacterized protein n=1 Tax=Microdochium bolleyi TaxID=196109 RepID=A0A136IQP0_9PEZI|nr:hypothetical protein Micbo1qcDRAFT_167593 [Microdochium bolleyi]